MTLMDRLRRRMCKDRCDVERPAPDDTTTKLIADAEVTRKELASITARLAGHVAALQALTRAQARSQEGEARGG